MKYAYRVLRRRVSTVWVALLAVSFLAAGCTDLEETPVSLGPDGPLAATSGPGASQAPQLIPASVLYSNTGKPNATGRAGSAEVTARALFGKDGVTTLEVTTGELDSGEPAPGRFAKVQVKLFDDGRRPLFTENDTRPDPMGSWSETYEGPIPGMTLQVQANVRGIDRNRTGVVTLREEVKRRPDLEASLTAPAQAGVGETVLIQGVVSELNGDVGAAADCALYVDGTEAERVSGIWVDAAGTVSCQFAPTFDATGTYALTFAVESVVPGDWDTANNQATATLEVVGGLEVRGRFSATEEVGYTITGSETNLWGAGQIGDSFDEGTRTEGEWQSMSYLVIERNGAPVFDQGTQIEITESSEGTALHTSTLTFSPGGWYASNQDGYQAMMFPHLFYIFRNSGDVTYYSVTSPPFSAENGLEVPYTDDDGTVYQWNQFNASQWGAMIPWQSDAGIDVTVHTPNGPVSVGHSVELTESQEAYSNWDNPTCTSIGTFYVCSASERNMTIRSGSVSF